MIRTTFEYQLEGIGGAIFMLTKKSRVRKDGKWYSYNQIKSLRIDRIESMDSFDAIIGTTAVNVSYHWIVVKMTGGEEFVAEVHDDKQNLLWKHWQEVIFSR